MKDSVRRLLLILGFSVAAALLAAVIPMFVSREVPKLSFLEPRVAVTPEPTPEVEDAVIIRTPDPTPEPFLATPVPVYPRGAVNLLVNGVPLFALDNRGTAELLVRGYLEECAYENPDPDSILLTATIDADLATVPADGSVGYVSYEDALNRLRRNRTLIPVRRTVERVEVLTETPEETVQNTRLLPLGTRMYLRYGVPSLSLVMTETMYREGEIVSSTEMLNTPVVAGISRTVLIGMRRLEIPVDPEMDPTKYPNEGEHGRTPATLKFILPIRGKLVGCYGLATGVMRYGVDYAAAPGTSVVAPESGTIVFLAERPGLGFVIEIAHDEGFLSRLSLGANTAEEDLTLGKHVEKGEPLASLPKTETLDLPVLHYELLIDGIPYNPLFWLPAQ